MLCESSGDQLCLNLQVKGGFTPFRNTLSNFKPFLSLPLCNPTELEQ